MPVSMVMLSVALSRGKHELCMDMSDALVTQALLTTVNSSSFPFQDELSSVLRWIMHIWHSDLCLLHALERQHESHAR